MTRWLPALASALALAAQAYADDFALDPPTRVNNDGPTEKEPIPIPE